MNNKRHNNVSMLSVLSVLSMSFRTAVIISMVSTVALGQQHHGGERIQLPGASGSGPYEALVDWIAAFEAKYPEADFTVSSVGSGASQSALWGDIDCSKKPVEALCSQEGFPKIEEEDTTFSIDENEAASSVTTKTIWGMGGGTLGSEDYVDHQELSLQMLPALGGPVLPVYSKDVTGNLGEDGDAALNMTFDVMVGIFNGSITSWRHPALLDLNPGVSLPKQKITVLVREDKSGMTETLTQAISASVSHWPEHSVGKLPEWPLKLTHTSSDSTSCKTNVAGLYNFKADGQTGIGLGLLRRPYSIGYLELGYFGQLTSFVSQVHMSSAANPDNFVPATAETISATMDGLVDVLDPDTLELNLAKESTPMGGYPISRYVYWYLKKNSTEFTSCYQAWLLCNFVKWTYEDPLAAEIASKHGWIVPPASVVNRSLEELREIQCLDDNTAYDDGKSRIISALDYEPPPYRVNLNQIDDIRPVGLALSGIVIATSIFFFLWIVWQRKARIVRASQPEFLLMICFGCCVMGAAIIPLTIDDSIATVHGCDIACMAFPWLTCCGFTIAFSALFSKIWRVNKLFNSKQFRRVKVEAKDVVIPFAVMFILNITFLMGWNLTDPLEWERVLIDSENSVGQCTKDGGLSTIFFSLLVVVNTSAIILANWQAYRARGISDEFSESKYVAIAMASILQVFLLGLPLAWLVEENPPARLFVSAGILFVISMSLLLLIFIPKMIYVWSDAEKKKNPSSNRPRSSIMSTGGTRISGLNFDVGSVCDSASAIEFDDDDDDEYSGAVIISHPELQQELKTKNRTLKDENKALTKKVKELERHIRAARQIQQLPKDQQQQQRLSGSKSCHSSPYVGNLDDDDDGDDGSMIGKAIKKEGSNGSGYTKVDELTDDEFVDDGVEEESFADESTAA